MLRQSIIRAHREQWPMPMKVLWISWRVVIIFAHGCEYQAFWCCSSECKYWHTLLKYNHRKKTQKKEKKSPSADAISSLKVFTINMFTPSMTIIAIYTKHPCLLCSNTFMCITTNKNAPIFYMLLHWLYCPLPWLSRFSHLPDLFGILEQWLNMAGNLGQFLLLFTKTWNNVFNSCFSLQTKQHLQH